MGESCANREDALEAACGSRVPDAPADVSPPCYGRDMVDAFPAAHDRLEALAAAAATLPDRLPRVRDPIHARRIANGVHLLLANLVNGRGALDLAVGEGLHALGLGDRALHLGYSNPNDYAREELGINASTAAKMERLARRLRALPLIREAVRRGEITPRKAEILARFARRGDEVRLLLIAKGETVRSLKARFAAPSDAADDQWLNLSAPVPPEKLPVIQKGLKLAGKFLGPLASKMERLEIMGQEFLGSHPAPEDDKADDVHFAADELEPLMKALEEQNRGWADLARGDHLDAPELGHTIDPRYIDRWLKEQVASRERWDDVVGRVALIFKSSDAWETLGFGSFGQYCEEGLGVSERAIAQRISLERSLQRTPLLREALREKRISYEKARLLARRAQPASLASLPDLIDKAAGMTCIALRRELEEKEEAQMCARGTVSVWMTVRVAELVKSAFRAARALAQRWLAPGECLVLLAEHFIETWAAAVKTARTLHQKILARDGYRCLVPGCSRQAMHAHHIEFRSHGGSDDPSNLISLCATHHLRGIHGGLLRVRGTAPDGLVWEFGLKPAYVPLGAWRCAGPPTAAAYH